MSSGKTGRYEGDLASVFEPNKPKFDSNIIKTKIQKGLTKAGNALTSDRAKTTYKYTAIAVGILAALVAAGLVLGHFGTFEPAGNWLQAKVSIANGWISSTATQANAWIQHVALPRIHGFFTQPNMAPWAYGLIYAGSAAVISPLVIIGVRKAIKKYKEPRPTVLLPGFKSEKLHKSNKPVENLPGEDLLTADIPAPKAKKNRLSVLTGPTAKEVYKYTAITIAALAALTAAGLLFGHFVGFDHAGTWLNHNTALANAWIRNTAIVAGHAIKHGATYNFGWPAWANLLFYGSIGALGGAAIGVLAIKGCKVGMEKYREHKLEKFLKKVKTEMFVGEGEEGDPEFDSFSSASSSTRNSAQHDDIDAILSDADEAVAALDKAIRKAALEDDATRETE